MTATNHNEKATSVEENGSNASQSPPPSNTESGNKKRGNSSAGVDSNGNPKPVKRRAAKACAACRSRKVRCDVMQRYHVTPDGEVTCSNCTMDGIKCVIEESKRRKKNLTSQPAGEPQPIINSIPQTWANGLVNPSDIENAEARRWSGSVHSAEGDDFVAHVPHAIYQNVNHQINKGEILRRAGFIPQNAPYNVDALHALLSSAAPSGDRTRSRVQDSPSYMPPLKHILPDYLKPLPQRMTSVDIDYLFAKGALSLPDDSVRNALLRSYLEYVHPYMPLIELYDLLHIIDEGSGESGRISLLLFQAIMFAGTAFVDIEYLKSAGYSNRKSARKAFFQKARVLYDFDYEIDRVALVQSLLLMTYWYETPDDQKDTWHWMGVAISLAHTIGLHRDPSKSNMEPHKKKLWKRIWWSCFMRDRLVALGMRRPTRVKDEDYDVPMLTEDDFETAPLPDSNTIIPAECTLARDENAQKELALMCIAKAKLCLCISQVLSAQYSVLVKHQGMQSLEGSTRSSVMLIPKKLDQTDEVKRCDEELVKWFGELPDCCLYSSHLPAGNTAPPVFVQRALLHMVYFTTLSALHRPQVLPSAAIPQPDSSRELQDMSRKKVREASRQITRISQDLHIRNLEKYLPTTGVTVLLPAIIIHLLDIKSCNEEARMVAMDGFCQCMLVLEKLRDNYSSADFATQFLEAAIRKADIDLVINNPARPGSNLRPEDVQATLSSDKVRELRERTRQAALRHTTPPNDVPEASGTADAGMGYVVSSVEGDHASAHTPPDSDSHTVFGGNDNAQNGGYNNHIPMDVGMNGFDNVDLNMTDFINFDTTINNDMVFEEGWHGESGGLVLDMSFDWTDQTRNWSRMGTPLPDSDMFGVGNAGTKYDAVEVKA